MLKVRTKSEIARKIGKRSYMKKMVSVLIIGLVIVACFQWFSGPAVFQTDKKFVILGFDGVDPGLVQAWWEELPNLQRLAESGTYQKLQTVIPAESPVSWSSFAVGGDPGRHGVFDFLRRPVGSYIPTEEAFAEREYAEFLFGQIPYKLPKAKLRRGGTAFWDVLSDAGVETSLIEVPITFPPPQLSQGRALSGLGVPDIRGMQATFHYFVRYPEGEVPSALETTFGGKIELLQKEGDYLTGTIWGPYDPVYDQEKREKEKRKLEADLTWCEWQTHLFTMQGEHVTDSNKQKLAYWLGMFVIQPLALKPYLRMDEYDERIKKIQAYLENGMSYVKEKGAGPSVARENMAELWETSQKLKDEINQDALVIKQTVCFKPVNESTIEIRIGKQTQQVKLKTWSDWFTVKLSVTSLISVQAICRFYPQEISPTFKVFMTSPDIDPRNPAVAISSPKSYSKELVDWIGHLYKTRGWAAETHGLKDGYLAEDAFIEDAFFVMNTRAEKTFETWDRTKSNVFVSVFSITDRVSHMFYHLIDEIHPMYDAEMAEKYGDTIKRVYIRMDEIVGEMMQRIGDDPNTLFMVISDHGFQPFRYQVNLNTWLYENGYLGISGSSLVSREMKLEDLLKKNQDDFFRYVDWSKTKAYALGLGQIYINLKGREPLGIVDPSEYDALCDEIAGNMQLLSDDRWLQLGNAPISYVKKRSEIWASDYANDEHDAPDMQVGFSPGYRVSWQTCLGGISKDIISDNMEKWSGDHCSVASPFVPGIFFCNRKIALEDPAIIDIAPTLLHYYNLNVPSTMDGRNLLSN
ncbi:MAG: hypothetical protein C4527_07420 [Candidatus Omnitrophota bacterium]|jgi:predicted AlkP superfamily phosphohydrolase/phosphomutase|nr:MAG: hypothetical protein C4527_07420 [Candidatus Omnitrophota bacterium]